MRERLGDEVRIVGAGLVSPGVVTDAGLALAPNNPGMETLTPADLAAALGLPHLAWANDVKAAALAEHAWGNLAGARCGLYLNLGTGLSAGAVIDGRPLNGAHGAALEIAYLMPASGSRPPGAASGAAPLEDLISGRALAEQAEQAGLAGWTASRLLTEAPIAAAPFVARFLDELTRAAVNLAVALDVDAVCVGGGIAAATDAFLPPLRAALDEYAPFPPRLALAAHPHDASLRGALRIACDEAGWPPERLGALAA